MNIFRNSSLLYKGLCVTLFLVLLILPSVNLKGFPNSPVTSKTLFFIYALIVSLSFYLFNVLFDKNKRLPLKISKVDIVVSLLFIFIIFNRYFIQSSYGFSIRFIELLGLATLYVILRTVPFKSFIWLFLAIILSAIIQAIYGNLQLLGYYRSNHSGFKITGSFFNPGPYSGFLVSVWPIALGFYLFKESIIKQVLSSENNLSGLLLTTIKYLFNYIPLIAVVTIILVIPATQSRASWLALLVSSIILLESRYHILKNLLIRISVLKKVLLTTSFLILLTLSLFGIYSLKKGSSDGRLFIWKVTTDMIKDFPLFGVGFDRFKAHYMNYQANYFAKNGETPEVLVADYSYYAFNEFIQFISENGFIGLLLFIIVFYTLFKTITTKKNRNLVALVKVSLLAIGVFSFFSYPMAILPIKIIMVYLIATLANLDSKKLKLSNNTKFQFPLIKVLTVTIGMVSIITSTYYTSKLHTGLKVWSYALSSYKYGDYEVSIKEYEEAYPMLKKNSDFLMNYGKALSVYEQDIKAIEILKKAKIHLNNNIIEMALGNSYKNLSQYKKAEQAYKQSVNMIPARFYPLYLLAKLYEESGQTEKAIVTAKNILNKNIKIPSTAVKQIQLNAKTIIDKIDSNAKETITKETPGFKNIKIHIQ